MTIFHLTYSTYSDEQIHETFIEAENREQAVQLLYGQADVKCVF